MKNKNKLIQLLNKPKSRYIKFHRQTKLPEGFNPFKKNPILNKLKTVSKSYIRFPAIKFSQSKPINHVDLYEALINRRSVRSYSQTKINFNQLCQLFYYSAGLNRKNRKKIRRFYPSAGALYPLETYFISLNTVLSKGLYHYHAESNSLELLMNIDKFKASIYFCQNFKNIAGYVIITAIFARNTLKYGDRGYKQILIEAGHLAQNIYLISYALQLGCCSIFGYYDDRINKLLDIDGINEAVIYTLAIGNMNQ